MKILPTMCKGIVFVHENGKTFEMAPFQTFIGASGQTLIRIGNNMLFFDKHGRLDGTESKVGGFEANSPEAAIVREAFEVQGKYKGLAPETPYFLPGAPGHEAETRAWAGAKQQDGGQLYVAPKNDGSLRNEIEALWTIAECARDFVRGVEGATKETLAAAIDEYEKLKPSAH